jgi:hypothetical protein
MSQLHVGPAAFVEEAKVAGVSVCFRVFAEQDLDFCTVLVSGHDAARDARLAERLDKGDVWAWALVTVECTLQVGDERFVGQGIRAACSFTHVSAFLKSDVYTSLKREAYRRAREALLRQVHPPRPSDAARDADATLPLFL